ncbi:uncharacterized protein LOC125010891 [Mugil cephalus]|uniref:uncharacterized protein LOC125010891 n=1 Tax=Mugil cephalus TaxID=48193 RepID=UPI001FB854AD|nr:uncharacterized protein LOC125010891 [Mugil cephalus]XP_047445756.1 uncharacterized protein LOC125010891 [Mugil cephalus]XP_047445757.1 uncharacterized protein LOC125010891 [Mugil cephalus]
MDPEANRTMEMVALGRPFGLGMLYDCRGDSLIPGMTLWDQNDLEKDTRERPSPNSDFEIVASESIEGKLSALNVKASLKASFCSGLVEVGGSAKYLNDQKTSKKQARVTLKYKTTTKFQELSMNHLGRGNVKHPYVFEQGLATHIVTGILYGAQAFFVFDREVSENENHQDIQGSLKVMIKKIPTISIEGEGSLKMEDKDKVNVEKFSCKFLGDFSLTKNPVSYLDAVEVYQSLPKLLGAKGENAVPMKVWLLPLTALDSTAAKLVRQISIRLVQQVQKLLEDFMELEIRCNDALSTTTAQQFPQVCKNIKRFKEMCCEFKLEFQQTLAKKLPSIRGGGEEESELADVLKKKLASPFNIEALNEWMDCKERKISILKSFTNKMKNTKIVPSNNVLQEELLSAEHAVCFVFTCLQGSPEPYLSALSNYLNGSNQPHINDIEKEQWFHSKEVADEMRTKVKLFSDFAEANKENENVKFLTVGLTNEGQKGSSIYLYGEGFTVTENFEPPSKPETVTAGDINHNSVTLKISPPRHGAENITSYSVEFCVRGEDEWKQESQSIAEEVTVRDLKPNTEYVFRCRAVTSAGVGPVSAVSDFITTLPYIRDCGVVVDAVKVKSILLKSEKGPLSVYKIPLKQQRTSVDGCRWFSFGKDVTKHSRTIMVVGATGAGKSTLINGMINYILGVKWEDSFRFKLVVEDQSLSQVHSQTSEVTVYKINHEEGFKIPYSLTIVDTPGFGDTRGITRDREITEQIRNLFSSGHGVTEIDAVCVVAQASLARLTPTQKYIFDSVLSIFGKDVAENIRVLVTFADGQQPPVLEAINAAGVPCPKTKNKLPVHFKFNNSALFADNKSAVSGDDDDDDDDDDDGGFDQMFWDMGTKSMKKFFGALNQVETKTLTLTKEVLRERQQLEISVENLQVKVKVGLAKMEEMKETKEKLKEFEAEINRNENFEFEVTVMKPFKHDISGSGSFITNCQTCHVTCHYPCGIPDDRDKAGCVAMGSDGYCKQCPGKCYWNVHFNQKYKWEYKEVKEKQTVKELKERYLKAKGGKMSVQALIDKLKDEYDRIQDEVVNLIKESGRCLNRLKEIALKPKPLSTSEYIDMLIEGEKAEAKPGWKKRVESLMKMKQKAEFMAKVEKRENPLSSQF